MMDTERLNYIFSFIGLGWYIALWFIVLLGAFSACVVLSLPPL